MKVMLISLLLIVLCEQAVSTGEGPHFHPIYTYFACDERYESNKFLSVSIGIGRTTTLSLRFSNKFCRDVEERSCNEDLSITFKGVKGTVKFANGISPTPSPTLSPGCVIKEDTEHHSGNWIISSKCFDKAKYNEQRVLYIAVYDENENEKRPTSTSKPTTTSKPIPTSADVNPEISAGHHIFKITCNAIPNEGIERVALAETGVKDLQELTEIKNEVGQVQILFKEKNSLDSPDVSEVYVGDRFYMYIEYTGKTDQYTIMPTTCTAFQGTYRKTDQQSQIVLWNKQDCLTSTSKDYNIMETFGRLNRTVVHSVMHGFRFTQKLDGGEDDVTIACQVQICTSTGTVSCLNKCGITTATTKAPRRRRNAEHNVYRTISRTIKVKTVSNSGDAVKGTYLLALICIGLSVKYQIYL